MFQLNIILFYYYQKFSKLHGTTESVYSNAQPSLREVEVDVHALLTVLQVRALYG